MKIADYVVQRCNKDLHSSISNLKLQKILYFIQAAFLVTKNAKCFSEDIEAWDFGPVVPAVYYNYRVFGSSNIPVITKLDCGFICDEDRKLLNEIIDECSDYSASYLVDVTHNQTPWKEAYSKPGRNNVISTESIRDYFLEN